MEPFSLAVERVITALGPGDVVTYGEVAREAGYPGAARAVGNLLAGGGDLPWWRVVRADGRLVPGHETEHARRLRAEGVTVVDGRIHRENTPAPARREPTASGRRRRGMATTTMTTLLAVLFLAASACGDGDSNAGASTSGPDPWGRTFLSTAVTEGGQDRPLVEDTRIRLNFGDDERTLGAQAGCNSMGGDTRIVGDELVVSDLATTEMGCDPPRHAQDEWLADFLTGKPTLRLAGHELTLTRGDTEIQLLDREAADPDRPLKGTRWTVDTVIDNDAASSVPEGADAHIVIGDDGRFGGSTGCNTMGGTVAFGPDDILIFSDVITTKMACDDDRNRLEQAVLAVLDGEVPFEIEADVLRLHHPSGRGLGLRAPQ